MKTFHPEYFVYNLYQDESDCDIHLLIYNLDKSEHYLIPCYKRQMTEKLDKFLKAGEQQRNDTNASKTTKIYMNKEENLENRNYPGGALMMKKEKSKYQILVESLKYDQNDQKNDHNNPNKKWRKHASNSYSDKIPLIEIVSPCHKDATLHYFCRYLKYLFDLARLDINVHNAAIYYQIADFLEDEMGVNDIGEFIKTNISCVLMIDLVAVSPFEEYENDTEFLSYFETFLPDLTEKLDNIVSEGHKQKYSEDFSPELISHFSRKINLLSLKRFSKLMNFLVDYFTFSHYAIIFKAWLVETKINTGDLDNGEKLVKIVKMLYPSIKKLKLKDYQHHHSLEILEILKTVFEDIFQENKIVEREICDILGFSWGYGDDWIIDLEQHGAEEDEWSEADKDEKVSVSDSWTSEESAWSVVDEKKMSKTEPDSWFSSKPSISTPKPQNIQSYSQKTTILDDLKTSKDSGIFPELASLKHLVISNGQKKKSPEIRKVDDWLNKKSVDSQLSENSAESELNSVSESSWTRSYYSGKTNSSWTTSVTTDSDHIKITSPFSQFTTNHGHFWLNDKIKLVYCIFSGKIPLRLSGKTAYIRYIGPEDQKIGLEMEKYDKRLENFEFEDEYQMNGRAINAGRGFQFWCDRECIQLYRPSKKLLKKSSASDDTKSVGWSTKSSFSSKF